MSSHLTLVPHWRDLYPTVAHTYTHSNQVAQTQAHGALSYLERLWSIKAAAAETENCGEDFNVHFNVQASASAPHQPPNLLIITNF